MIGFVVGHLAMILLSAVVAVAGGAIRQALVHAFARQAVQDMVLNYAGVFLHRGLSEITGPLASEFLDYAKATVGGSIARLGVTDSTLLSMLSGKIGIFDGAAK